MRGPQVSATLPPTFWRALASAQRAPHGMSRVAISGCIPRTRTVSGRGQGQKQVSGRNRKSVPGQVLHQDQGVAGIGRWARTGSRTNVGIGWVHHNHRETLYSDAAS